MISCRIYSCEKGCDNTPLFFRIVKDFIAIQIIENFKDDESYRELKNNVGILPHFRKKGSIQREVIPTEYIVLNNLSGN
jgi:hypothetical protein